MRYFYIMKSSTIRLIVVLATLCIVGITITQVYWVKRAFDLKEAEFERQINTALINVAQQIFKLSDTPSPANNPVKQLSTNYFVVSVNSEIDASLLEFLLRTEFEKRNIIKALKATNWKVSGKSGAAVLLNMVPSTLSSRIVALGIKVPG